MYATDNQIEIVVEYFSIQVKQKNELENWMPSKIILLELHCNSSNEPFLAANFTGPFKDNDNPPISSLRLPKIFYNIKIITTFAFFPSTSSPYQLYFLKPAPLQLQLFLFLLLQ